MSCQTMKVTSRCDWKAAHNFSCFAGCFVNNPLLFIQLFDGVLLRFFNHLTHFESHEPTDQILAICLSGVIFRIQWSKMRNRIASVSDDRTVRVWDLTDCGKGIQVSSIFLLLIMTVRWS